MWLPHLLHLLKRAVHLFFRDAIGSTFLAELLLVILALLPKLVSLFRILKRHGFNAMLARWKQYRWYAGKVTLVCALVIYVPIFIWKIGEAVYEDHMSMVESVRAQKKIAADATSNLSARFKPQLQLFIDEVAVGSLVASGRERAISVLITASIANHGAPTIAEGFRALFFFSDGSSREVGPSIWRNPKMPMSWASRTITHLNQEDELAFKAMSKPIETNSKIRGQLTFMLDSKDFSKLGRGASVKLSCRDIDNREVSVSYNFSVLVPRPPASFPGMSIPR